MFMRRYNKSGFVGAVVFVGTLLAGSSAFAQELDLNGLTLQGARSRGTTILPSARLLEPGEMELSLTYGHDDSLVTTRVETGAIRGETWRDETWLSSRDALVLQLAVSPVSRLELLAALPILASQSAIDIGGFAPADGGSIGDLSLSARYALLQPAYRAGGVLAAIQMGFALPTGAGEQAFGEESARFGASATAGYEGGALPWAAMAHIGYQMGEKVLVGDTLFGNHLVAGLGASWRFDWLQLHADALGRRVLEGADGAEVDRDSLELLGGARLFGDGLFVDLGAGYGVIENGLTPQWRVLASVGATDLLGLLRERKAREERALVEPPKEEDRPAEGGRGYDQGIIDGYRMAMLDGAGKRTEEVDPAVAAAARRDEEQRARARILSSLAVYFETGRHDLDQVALNTLRLVARMVAGTNEKIALVGHADERGSEEANDALSEKRAEAVKSALVDAGISAERLSARGAGKREPFVQGKPKAMGMSLNRAVAFEIEESPRESNGPEVEAAQ